MIGSQLNGAPRRPGLLATLWAWSEMRRQRRHLARLSAHELKDIGISRLEAHAEARRPFWDTRPSQGLYRVDRQDLPFGLRWMSAQ
ncbi:MAG: DUF1127 domain-containing protein [Pseudomonadota bacterium]